MSRGRPRKLKEQKLLENTYRKDRDKPTVNGELITTVPESNVPMSDKAYSYFSSIAQRLINLGVLNETDLAELELMAYEFGNFWKYEDEQKTLKTRYQKVNKEIDEADEVGDSTLSRNLRNKHKRLFDEYKTALKQRNICLEKATKMSAKFGLNPIDRQKLSVKPLAVEVDPFAEF